MPLFPAARAAALLLALAAFVAHWPHAAEAVAARFPEAQIVVPSHGAPGGRALLTHTAALARAAALQEGEPAPQR